MATPAWNREGFWRSRGSSCRCLEKQAVDLARGRYSKVDCQHSPALLVGRRRAKLMRRQMAERGGGGE